MFIRDQVLRTGVILAGFVCYAATAEIHAAASVPISGTVTYTDTITANPDNTSCPLTGMSIGTGTVSHLGRAAFVSTDCLTFDGLNYTIHNGTFTLTAANGDTITGTFTGTFSPSGRGAVYVMQGGDLTITGGSGRFKNASGGGPLQASEDLITHQGTTTLAGRISY